MATSILQAVEVTWPTVGLALVNVFQVVALAWIASEQMAVKKRLQYREERDREVLK
jgi:hypothetical protein